MRLQNRINCVITTQGNGFLEVYVLYCVRIICKNLQNAQLTYFF